MMLYSINPYQLGDQLSDYETEINDYLTFEEFSNFLLIDRQPTYFQYSKQNLQQARSIGRGIKCAPIIGKCINQQIYQLLIDIFNSLDMFGNQKVQTDILVKKIKKIAIQKNIMDQQIIQIVNINKILPLNRLIYELQYCQKPFGISNEWTFNQFNNYICHYFRLTSLISKDKLIIKQIMAGKYDPSYIYICSDQVLKIIKEIFQSMPKFAEYFVLTQKFIRKLYQNQQFDKIRNVLVRSENNRYVKKQTIQQSLIRILSQADKYIDEQQLLEFLTNRGRPTLIQYNIYLINLQKQLNILNKQQQIHLQKYKYKQQQSTSSDDDQQFNKIIKFKKRKRKQQKLNQIYKNNNYQLNKQFNITIPIPYKFQFRKNKISIRQRKLKQILKQKQIQQKQLLKPIKIKQVPLNVKQNLYAKIIKDQQKQRQDRLERFRIEIMNRNIHISDRLIKPIQKKIHCDFSKEEYKFIARPMPWYCQVNLLDRINKKKQQRRQKILENILNRHNQYEIPQGVQNMINRQEILEQKKKNRTTSTTQIANQCTFIPKITQNMPDFQTIHQHLDFDMENAKKQKQSKICLEPFSFQNRPKKSKTTYQITNIHKLPKQHKIIPKQEKNTIPLTMKYEALVQLRQRQQREKIKKEQEQKKSEAIRGMRHEKFATYFHGKMKKYDKDMSNSRAIIEERIKQFKRNERQKKIQYQQKMIDIYTKVFNRPLLAESSGGYGQNEIKRMTNYDQNKLDRKINNPRQKYNKQQQQNKLDKNRKMMQHPPGQYLLQDSSNNSEKNYDKKSPVEQNQKLQRKYQIAYDEEDDGQYLSQNGRYTT